MSDVSAPAARPGSSKVRRDFGRRLRAARTALGYTQQQMAHALGIQPARYSKYEIGRSEAPFEVLIRISELAKVDLDYLIGGQSARRGRRPEPTGEQLNEFLEVLPSAAAVFDKHRRLLAYNRLYRDLFFAEQTHLLKRGTPQEVLLRSWAYAQGFTAQEVEALVRARWAPNRASNSPIVLRVGGRHVHIAESVDSERTLVLINDLSQLPAGEEG